MGFVLLAWAILFMLIVVVAAVAWLVHPVMPD
jgi:hypothetical protein